jgi:hypothetical protein
MRTLLRKIKAAAWYAWVIPWVLVRFAWIAWVAGDDDGGDRAGKADSIGCDTDDLLLDRAGRWTTTKNKRRTATDER